MYWVEKWHGGEAVTSCILSAVQSQCTHGKEMYCPWIFGQGHNIPFQRCDVSHIHITPNILSFFTYFISLSLFLSQSVCHWNSFSSMESNDDDIICCAIFKILIKLFKSFSKLSKKYALNIRKDFFFKKKSLICLNFVW